MNWRSVLALPAGPAFSLFMRPGTDNASPIAKQCVSSRAAADEHFSIRIFDEYSNIRALIYANFSTFSIVINDVITCQNERSVLFCF
jgi:hypothetical protein